MRVRFEELAADHYLTLMLIISQTLPAVPHLLLKVQAVHLLLRIVRALWLALRVLQQLVPVQTAADVLLRAHEVLLLDVLGGHVRVLLGGLRGVVLLQLFVEEVDVI